MGRYRRLHSQKPRQLRIIDIAPNKPQLCSSSIRPKRRAPNNLQFAQKPLRVGAMNVDRLTRQAAHGVEAQIHKKNIDIIVVLRPFSNLSSIIQV